MYVEFCTHIRQLRLNSFSFGSLKSSLLFFASPSSPIFRAAELSFARQILLVLYCCPDISWPFWLAHIFTKTWKEHYNSKQVHS